MKSLHPLLFLASLLGFALVGCKLASIDDIKSDQALIGQLVFCGRPLGSERFDIFLLDLRMDKSVNLTEKYVSDPDDGFGHSIGCDDYMLPYRITGVAWSPNGDLLILNSGGPYFQVPYVLEISGSGEIQNIVVQWPAPPLGKQVYENPLDFAWSPNGDKIAFDAMTDFDGYSNLFVGDASDWQHSNPDTPVVQLTHEYRYFPGVVYAPSWSPDGKKIAVSLAGPSSGIMIVSADGAQSVQVSDETSAQLNSVEKPSPWADFPSITPRWSPDGREIIFVAAATPKERTALFKVDQNGENLALLIPEGVNNPIFSPGSGFIAYIEYTNSDLKTVGRIVRIDLDGGNRQVLATIKTKGIKSILANYYIRDLSWSPDGKWLVFTSNHSGQFQLYVVSADGKGFRQVIDFSGDAVYPQWRPDRPD
jgi:Tol biopolymer transport system component